MTSERRSSIPRARQEQDDLIGRIPKSLISLGLAIFSIIFVIIIFLSWFIKYPDIINAKVIITTEPAPVNLFVRTTGKIFILKSDNASVSQGETIAYMQSTTEYYDVTKVLELIDSSNQIDLTKSDLALGELEESYSVWQKLKEEQNLFQESKIIPKQISALKNQITFYRKISKVIEKQLKIMDDQVDLANYKFYTDSLLFQKKVYSRIDYNNARSQYLSEQRNGEELKMTLLNNQLQISSLEREIIELEGQLFSEMNRLKLGMEYSTRELKHQILKWKELHVFVSPFDGTVNYLDFLENNKFVSEGTPIFSIIPNSKQILGRAELPLGGSGKVKVGQNVNIRLYNYPYQQYGFIRGKIVKISELSNQDKYLVRIDLVDSLRTNTDVKLPFKQQMQGDTEIITEDLRLIERLVFQFRELTNRSRGYQNN